MTVSRTVRIAAALVLLAWAGTLAPSRGRALEMIETPMFEPLVAVGTLPPAAARIPKSPAVVALDSEGRSLGAHGGTLNLLMARQKDIRLMMVYGYARLVGYDRNLQLVADIVERIETEDQRRFTFHLRKGHRWSDGHPFTTEDFRYYWEDVANDPDISPYGPPKTLIVDGEAPRVEIIDDYTVRYSWSNANPEFLPAIAGARPLFIYRPAHYLKQFHARYADADRLEAKIAAISVRNWSALHHRFDHPYRFDDVNRPSLQPWRNTTRPPSERFVFVRNPYYHRIDRAGRQLPYIDNVIVGIASSGLIPAKAGFGESDLQARYLRFDHYTFLKTSEKTKNFSVYLWQTALGAKIALFPNLNAQDPVWRELLRDPRFRRALSLAIDRQAINEVLYFGLGRPSANTVLPKSPLYKPEYQAAWASYDKEKANDLLDEIGLTRRNESGIRLLPDGRPVEIIIDTAGEKTEESDALEMIKSDWRRIGVEIFTKPSQRETFRNRIFAGAAIMSVWSGLENALPTAEMSPRELAPTGQTQYQWPKWGEYYETAEASGQPPDMAIVQELQRLNRDWRHAKAPKARQEIWHKMLAIHADQVFTIGLVNGIPRPIVVSNELRNVPREGVYNWEPGAFFGIYKPDTFWFTERRR